MKNSALLRPYSRTMHMTLWWVLGGAQNVQGSEHQGLKMLAEECRHAPLPQFFLDIGIAGVTLDSHIQ